MRSSENKIVVMQTVLASEFGMQVEDLTAIDPADLGEHSLVYSAVHRGRNVIVKTGDTVKNYQIDMAAHDLVRGQVPVPVTLEFSENAKHIEQPVVIQTAAEGIALNKVPQVPKVVWTDVGRTLRKINEIPMQGFGRVGVIDGMIQGIEGAFTMHLPDREYLLTHGFISESDVPKLDQAQSRIGQESTVNGALLHNDFSTPHIFTDGEKVTCVLDFANARAGDPRHDIGMATFFLPSQARGSFSKGYGETARDPLVADYRLLVSANKVGYIHKKGLTNLLPPAVTVFKRSLAQA